MKTGTAAIKLASVLVLAVLLAPLSIGAMDDISDDLRTALNKPVKAFCEDKKGEKENSETYKNTRCIKTKQFNKVDDSTYTLVVHLNFAGGTQMIAEKHLLTLSKEGADWSVSDDETVDTFDGMHQINAFQCHPFESFTFEQGGLTMTAKNGGVCNRYHEDTILTLTLMAEEMNYGYIVPDYLDYKAVQKILENDYKKNFIFDVSQFEFKCDPISCANVMDTAFTGLKLNPVNGFEFTTAGLSTEMTAFISGELKDYLKERDDARFTHYATPVETGRHYIESAVRRNDKHAFGVFYDNFGGFELTAWVETVDDRAAANDPEGGHIRYDVFGYYTDETLATSSPYEIEQRDDYQSRWHEVVSLNGQVDLALEDDEKLDADINYEITIKQDTKYLPFFIAAIRTRSVSGKLKTPPMDIASIQMDGEELTWVKTGRSAGLLVFPEEKKAGDKINLHAVFSTKAIKKINNAASQMARFGWLPFVSFGDFIDNFSITVRSPAKYKVLGIGHLVSESTEGDVRTTEWKSDSAVVFPTIIFGRYLEAESKHVATKLDGTEIPVKVFVDEISAMQTDDIYVDDYGHYLEVADATKSGARGIRQKQLPPIATQAAVAIDIYKEISGLDYPYGKLDLVNDPVPALYGQAPSSLIYLGSRVFRGEGTMASQGGGTGTAKFLKSVVAHEVGHQWWGSRVSNANDRNYWFVESLAEYFSAIYLERVYGPKEYQEQVDEWRRTILRTDGKGNVQASYQLFAGDDQRSVQANIYNKGPYAFHILRETFGDEAFFKFLKQFSMELAEKREIVTRDIQIAAEKALGGIDPDGNTYNVDLEWFFDQWIRSAGVPQYNFTYDVREAEDGNWLIEGTIEQRVVVGNEREFHVLKDKYYRGVVDITVKGVKGQDFKRRTLVDKQMTPFRLSVPSKPLDVAVNEDGEMLTHQVWVNKTW